MKNDEIKTYWVQKTVDHELNSRCMFRSLNFIQKKKKKYTKAHQIAKTNLYIKKNTRRQ